MALRNPVPQLPVHLGEVERAGFAGQPTSLLQHLGLLLAYKSLVPLPAPVSAEQNFTLLGFCRDPTPSAASLLFRGPGSPPGQAIQPPRTCRHCVPSSRCRSIG